jgi:hypothetical protein
MLMAASAAFRPILKKNLLLPIFMIEYCSFLYDPDRTKTDDDLQAEKISKKVIYQNETNFLDKYRSQAISTLEIVLNYLTL